MRLCHEDILLLNIDRLQFPEVNRICMDTPLSNSDTSQISMKNDINPGIIEYLTSDSLNDLINSYEIINDETNRVYFERSRQGNFHARF